MRESLAERDETRRDARMSTFHGLCSWILRTEARALGLSPSVWVHDEEDAEALIASPGVQKPRQAMFRLHAEMSSEPIGGASPSVRHRRSNRAVGRGSTSAQRARRHRLRWAGLSREGGITEFPSIAEKWSQRFDWVQDEVQDTHISEYDVIRHMAARAVALLVGDLDQTIYGWRSDPQAIIAALEADRGPATAST